MATEPLRAPLNLQARAISPAPLGSSAGAPAVKTTKSTDASSDRAAEAFVRRVLCAHQQGHNGAGQTSASISDLLPPLTSSNEIDLQLYAIIAIILKDFVYTWYAKITPDHGFVDEIVHIIAHCTRALEERARHTDAEVLLLDELPSLFNAHVIAYRTAAAACSSGSTADRNVIYHALRPHPALDPAPDTGRSASEKDKTDDNFRSYCHVLAQGILAVLLPTEDLQNPALRALVSEVTADLILGNFVGQRMCEAGFIYESLRKTAEVVQPRLGIEKWTSDIVQEQPSRLSRFGLLTKRNKRHGRNGGRLPVSAWVKLALNYLLVAIATFRALATALLSASSLPSRRDGTVASPSSPVKGPGCSAAPRKSAHRAVAAYRLWPTLGQYLSLQVRMPWMAGLLALVDHYTLRGHDRFGVGGEDGKVDRLLAHHLLRPVFPISQHLPTILLNLRQTLFPGNTFNTAAHGAGTSDDEHNPSPAARAAATAKAKRAAAFALLVCIPKSVARIYFAPNLAQPQPGRAADPAPPDQDRAAVEVAGDDDGDEQSVETRRERQERREVEAMIADIEGSLLDVFSNEYMNRHLMLGVLERTLVALLPELGRDPGVGKGVQELLAERGLGLVG